MSSTSNKKSSRPTTNNQDSCSVFGIKASVIIVGFILLIGILVLFYFSTWSMITKYKYAVIASAYFYKTATNLLIISTVLTIIAIVGLFITSWSEHEKGMKLVRFTFFFCLTLHHL